MGQQKQDNCDHILATGRQPVSKLLRVN